MIERCVHTGVSVPECGCGHCGRALVERHAPWLKRTNVVPLRRPGTSTGERPVTRDVRLFG